MGILAIIVVSLIALYYLTVYGIPAFRRKTRGRNVVFKTPQEIDADLKAKKDMLLIDIRSEVDFYGMFGHIDGAVSLPYGVLRARLTQAADSLAGFRDTPIVLTGLSQEKELYDALDVLKQKGFSNVALLDKSIAGWLRAGFPTVEKNVRKV